VDAVTVSGQVERTIATDLDLLEHLKAGQPAAFAALMRSNNQRLYRLARGFLRNDAEAEDAVQETYLKAFTHLDGFRGECSLATWLGRIVVNEALGRLRRQKAAPDRSMREMPQIDSGDFLSGGSGIVAALPAGAAEATPEQMLARAELRRTIEKAVDNLPPHFRSVFMLRAIEQMTIEETAAYLGIPAQTVKTRFHRANKLLRQALSAEFGGIFDGVFPFLGPRCTRLTADILCRLGLPVTGAGAGAGRKTPDSSDLAVP
jgi:RNA polymerase sigma-70 factor (ECF subfamily)